MEAIICTDLSWGFGQDNDLLYNIKEDLLWFKEKTLNRNCVMGSNTFTSLPKLLLNRKLWVVTSQPDKILEKTILWNATVIQLEDLDQLENPICIGGSVLLKTLYPQLTKIYLTKVNKNSDASVKIDWLEPLLKDWEIIESIESSGICRKSGEVTYSFLTLKKRGI
jgi:dihydrofolate reductase